MSELTLLNDGADTIRIMMHYQMQIIENAPPGEPRLQAICPTCGQAYRMWRGYPGIPFTSMQGFDCCNMSLVFLVKFDAALSIELA